MDKDLIKDDLIAQANLPFTSIQGKEGSVSLPLLDSSGQRKGTLKFSFYRGDLATKLTPKPETQPKI
jgi:hypothetical protein